MKNVLASCGGYGRYGHIMYEHLPTIGIHHLQIGAPSLDQIDEIQARLRQHGLEAVVLTARYLEEDTVATAEATKDWNAAFDTAVEMGVSLVHSSIKAGPGAESRVYDWLKRMGDAAADRNLTLVLETHPDLLHNGDVCLRTMEVVNHPAVRINFDTGNMSYYNEDGDAVAELKKIAPYVASTHLKDHSGNFEEWNFGTLGTGVVDFAGVRQTLAAADYPGPWILQVEGDTGEDTTEAEVKERMAQSVAHLQGLGFGGRS
jgi:sugar phosphate isomerase/epimerase